MSNIIFQFEKIPENFNEARYLQVLNREELYRYKSFSNVLRKRQFLFSRFILKNKLFEVTGINSDDVYFDIDSHGKPSFKKGRLNFSISHSENYVAYVISKKEVGLDIQVQRNFSNLDGMIEKVCHENEKKYLSESNHKESEFLKIWTLKEAYSKCIGLGFQAKFSEVDVSSLLHGEFEIAEPKNIMIKDQTFECVFRAIERSQVIYMSIFKQG